MIEESARDLRIDTKVMGVYKLGGCTILKIQNMDMPLLLES